MEIMKMPKHFYVVKSIICKLSGEQCGESIGFHESFYKCCENCDYYQDFKKSGLTLEEWEDRLARIEEKRFHDDYTDLEE
jgi:hypothetical protein